MKRNELGVRFFIVMDSRTEFPGHAGAVFVLSVLGTFKNFIRKLLDCKNKMQK